MSGLGRTGSVIILVLALGLLTPGALAQDPPPAAPGKVDRPWIEVIEPFRVSFNATRERTFNRLAEWPTGQLIHAADAQLLLADLDLAIAYLDEIADGAQADTPSAYPWFRVIHYQAEDASYWFEQAFRVVYQMARETRAAGPDLRTLAGEGNRAMSKLFATFEEFAGCPAGTVFVQLQNGHCYRLPANP